MPTMIAELRSGSLDSQPLSVSFHDMELAGDASPLNPNKRLKNPDSNARPRGRSSSPRRRSRQQRSVKVDPDFKRSTPAGGALWSPQQPTAQSPRARPRPPHPEAAFACTEEAFKQPETRPISQDQLVAEVKGIYAGLVMVESKCIEVDNATSSQTDTKLNNEQWQALIALHRTLLHEHHDFFLASQHPSASRALKQLATKYAMPARMWRHGIHSFLELLRHRLPYSLEHMLSFIYLAYSMMALLHETVPAFEDTWIECLGDLSRYRMAIEDDDIRDCELWTSVSRNWYREASEHSPTMGRLYRHLAILARPNALKQLYYYSKSLCVPLPFNCARESVSALFHPQLQGRQRKYLRPETRDKVGAILRNFERSFIENEDGCPPSYEATEWRVIGSVHGVAIDALADTGANANAISKDQAAILGVLPESQSLRKNIRLPNGKVCSTIGTAILRFKFASENKVHEVCCNIVENLQHGVIFGYDFLKKTQTLSKYFKERVRSIICSKQQRVTLCLLDDEITATHCRARMVGLMEGQQAVVVPDTGSGIMAISSPHAQRLGLEVDATRKMEVTFADGSTAVTSGVAKATWQFLGPDPGKWEYEWHVIDNLPVDAILNVHFVMQHDVFSKHHESFVQESQDLSTPELADIFGIVAEGSVELAVLADEFLTDLLSPNPFDYKKVEKEAARRTEMSNGISNLTSDAQIQQRLNEQARIRLWDEMKDLKERGEDWTTDRDQYVSEVRQLQAAQVNQQAQPSMHAFEPEASSTAGRATEALKKGRDSIRGLFHRVTTKARSST